MRILTISRSLGVYILLLVLSSGCSNGGITRIDGAQYLPVNAVAENKVALLRGFGHGEIDSTRNAYKDFENCIRRGLREVESGATLVRWEKWSMGQEYAMLNSILEQPRSFELTNEAKGLLSGLDIQYLVKVVVENGSTKKRLEFHNLHQTFSYQYFSVGQAWSKTARMRALIYETDTGRLSGELSAALSEAAYWQVIMAFGIIPIPGPYYDPDVEHGACKSLGTALGRFFNGVGNEHIEPYLE